MPHCIIEYSKSLESQIAPATLVTVVHEATANSELFNVSHIKTRALSYDDFLIGGNNTDFIHVTIRLHQGRTTQQKKQLSSTIIEQLIALKLTRVSLTVEVVDINTECYSKH